MRKLYIFNTERTSTKLGHIFTYDCYFKNLVQTPTAFTSTGNGGTKTLFGTGFELWPNVSLPPKFGEIRSRNGWQQLASFCPPLNFCIGWHCPPYRMDVIKQTAGKLRHVLCSGTSLQSRTTEYRAGSRWALPFIFFELFINGIIMGYNQRFQNLFFAYHFGWKFFLPFGLS